MAWQAIAQALFVHTRCALAIDGIGHVAHVAGPQRSTSLSAKQPTRAVHMCIPVPHEVPQTPADEQVAALPPGQAEHETLSTVPQVATAESETHCPLHK